MATPVNDIQEALYESEADVPADRQAGQRAGRSLAATVAKLHGAMPLSAAAQRLLSATQSSDYKVTEVVRIIESDPALASRIMRQVSSALVGRVRCASIAQAVTMLGARALQTIAVAASAIEWFGDEPVAQVIVRHMNRTGEVARFLARHSGLVAEEMYTCGLLHDLGKLMLLRGGDLDYSELVALGTRAGNMHRSERERYGFDHAVLAGHVLNAWKLPHPLPRVVAWHHQPTRAYRAPGQVPRMVALVRLADHLAYALTEPDPRAVATTITEQMPEELRVLALSGDAAQALCTELAEETLLEIERGATQPVPRAGGAEENGGAAARDMDDAREAAAPKSLGSIVPVEIAAESAVSAEESAGTSTAATMLDAIAPPAIGQEAMSPAALVAQMIALDAEASEAEAAAAEGSTEAEARATMLDAIAPPAVGQEAISPAALAAQMIASDAEASEAEAAAAEGSTEAEEQAPAAEEPATSEEQAPATEESATSEEQAAAVEESATSEEQAAAVEESATSEEQAAATEEPATSEEQAPATEASTEEAPTAVEASTGTSAAVAAVQARSEDNAQAPSAGPRALARSGYVLAGPFFFAGALAAILAAEIEISETEFLIVTAAVSVAPLLADWIHRRRRRGRQLSS